MSLSRTAAVLAALMILAPGCSSPRQPEKRTLRLIDRIGRGQVLRSPLLSSAGGEASGPVSDLPDSIPLIDEGSGSKLPELKRKLRMGGAERNVLLAPPASIFAVPVRLPGEAVLEFGIGIRRSPEGDVLKKKAALPESKDPGGVHFSVTLEIEGRGRRLFEKYLDLPDREAREVFVFFRHSLDLPYPDRDARLVLETRGEGSPAAFWVNPVVYDRGNSGHGVILISIDTLRADHVGCLGYDRPTTPHIDALAGEGALFERVYASSPWTLPSHVSMLTGLHGPGHQVDRDDERMDPELVTLADRLRAAGYETGAFTGGGFVSAAYGFSKGFDSYDESAGGVHHQDSAARVGRAAVEWLERHRNRDFFLFLHTYQPHSPYACPPPHKTMFLDDDSLFGHADLVGHLGGKANLYRPLPEAERKNLIDLYDGEIRYTDDLLVGPLIDKLRRLGLYDRCLIVITSDHGEEFFEHGGWGHGHSLYEEALRVPLVVKFPGGRFAGERRGSAVNLVDILPTVCGVLGIESEGSPLDGRSLIPVLEGKETADRDFMAELAGNLLNSHVPGRSAVNRGLDKLILNQRLTPDDLEFFTFPPPVTDAIELFDLENDPEEVQNLVHQRRELSQRLIKRIREIYAAAGERGTGRAEVDDALREQLKALGYIR